MAVSCLRDDLQFSNLISCRIANSICEYIRSHSVAIIRWFLIVNLWNVALDLDCGSALFACAISCYCSGILCWPISNFYNLYRDVQPRLSLYVISGFIWDRLYFMCFYFFILNFDREKTIIWFDNLSPPSRLLHASHFMPANFFYLLSYV